MLAVGALLAAVAAVLSVYHLEGAKLKARSLQYSSASTQVLVDSNPSSLGNVAQSFEQLSSRAEVYANFMASPTILESIAQQVGLSANQLYAAGPVNAQEPRVEQEPTALRRNVEITGETKPYRLNYESQSNLPTITINTQAPTTSQAIALANAAAYSLQHYVANVESGAGIAPRSQIVIRRLGPATGGVVDGGISKTLAIMVFVAVFVLWCVLLLVGSRFRRAWRDSAALQEAVDHEAAVDREHEFALHDITDRGKDGGVETPETAPRVGHIYASESAPFAPATRRDEDRAVPIPARGIR
jgi:hypothetical protein